MDQGDKNHRDIVSLKEHFESRFDAIYKTMQASEKAMDVRLEAMNELRDQINRERGQYISRSEHDAVHNGLDNDIKILQLSRAELAGKASMGSVFFAGLISVISLGIAVGSFISNVVMR